MDSEIISVRSNVKYSNTVIYKICCKDESISNIYIGHTTNFENRKLGHMKSSKIDNYKVYKFIRNNGGWDNWSMIILETYTCVNLYHASKLEWLWWKKLGATLNTVIPGIDYIKWFLKKPNFQTQVEELEVLSRKYAISEST
jgi:hypothetical protein